MMEYKQKYPNHIPGIGATLCDNCDNHIATLPSTVSLCLLRPLLS